MLLVFLVAAHSSHSARPLEARDTSFTHSIAIDRQNVGKAKSGDPFS